MPDYRVRVTKDHLVFSAAHFVTIGDWCERLHGHNWRVAAEVAGPLDADTFVVDFIMLRDELQDLVIQLDHRMLLPERHRQMRLEQSDREIEVRHGDRRWVFPREECVVLPVEQTSAELIAHWIGERLIEALWRRGVRQLETLQVEVEENFGQWAICRLPWPPTESIA